MCVCGKRYEFYDINPYIYGKRREFIDLTRFDGVFVLYIGLTVRFYFYYFFSTPRGKINY